MRAALPLAVLLVSPGIAAGCGGHPPTRAEYLAAADRICAQADRDIGALGRAASLRDFRRITDGAAPIARKALHDLRELDGPDELRQQAGRVYDGIERRTDLIQLVGAAAARDDAAEAQRVAEQARRQQQAVQRRAEQVGFRECGIAG